MSACRSTTEVAGLGRDPNLLRYAKQSFMGLVAFPLNASRSTTLTLSAGAILAKDVRSVNVKKPTV